VTERTWAIVLAAGDGTRLRSLTTDREGIAVPKQFCSLDGGPSLLALALERAARVASSARIASIVASRHRHWWRGELSSLVRENIIVQPDNRGTAAGVLLPLLRVLDRDPKASVVLLPSDHFVGNETTLARVIRRALELIERGSRSLYLLGITPDEPDTGFGWIVPAEREGRSVYRVQRFVEKPPQSLAAQLMLQGGVWNSFIIAGTGAALLAMFQRRLPEITAAMLQACGDQANATVARAALAQLYQALPDHDFCRDVLQGEEEHLRVLKVPQCGWTDLGTPERVACCLDRWRPQIARHDRALVPHPTTGGLRGTTGPVLSAALSRV
jgi:mannose-1-phosphate guanylyltransferase